MREANGSQGPLGPGTRWPYALLALIFLAGLGLGILIYWFATRSQEPPAIAEATIPQVQPAAVDGPQAVSSGVTITATTAAVTIAATTIPIPDCQEPLMAVYIQPDSVVIHSEPIPTSAATSVAIADPMDIVLLAGELLAHWSFDEDTSAEVADISGNGNGATLSHTAMLRPAEGYSGGALAFENPEDALLVAQQSHLETILQAPVLQRTVALWVKANDVTTPQILYEEGGRENGFALRLKDGLLQARVASNVDGETMAAQADYPFTTMDEWQHVAVVFNNGVLALYLNGELVKYVDNVPFAVVKAHTDPAAVGATAGSNAFADDTIPATFHGLIDDVVLFATEYIEPLPPPTTTATTAVTPATATATRSPVPTPTDSPTPVPVTATKTPTPTTDEVITPAPAAPMVQDSPPLGAIQGVPLLDLPFPYDGINDVYGGSATQFRRVCQSTQNEGRITSYYDHLYPLYPAPQAENITNGREPNDPPYAGQMLPFDGVLRITDYSGHPGYDFSPYERGQATTPLFAAADGVVYDVAIHAASGAYYIEILHETEGFGDFLTRYWHLEPDEYFETMRDRVGQPIEAGERIGTIGNSGWSTGHHLHFEVRCDCNDDGVFTLDETLDPFGFIPSVDYQVDPWEIARIITDGKGDDYYHVGSRSRYLWKYPLGTSAIMPAAGGGQLTQYSAVGGEGGSELCAPEGSVPAGSTVNWSWVADPPPSPGLAGTGHGCALSVITPDGTQVEHFTPPILITIPFEAEDLANIENPASTLAIYWQRPGVDTYKRLDTIVNLDDGLVSAQTEYPGICALLGLPNRDLVAPRTTILVNDPGAGNDVFSGPVSVSLSSVDEDVDAITYSVDGGYTWHPYLEPFVIPGDAKSLGVPDLLSDQEGIEGLVRGPGRYLVLAASRDRAGNEEYPPAAKTIYIEPAVPTDRSISASEELEMAVCEVAADSLLRLGPQSVCAVLKAEFAGEELTVMGRDDSGNWIQVQTSNGRLGWIRAGRCGKLAADRVILAENIPPDCVSPTPTATPIPEEEPRPPSKSKSDDTPPQPPPPQPPPAEKPYDPPPYPP